MGLQPGAPAPYTSASTVTLAIEKYRDRGLGDTISTDVLIRAGVSSTIASRTLQSMKLLGLVEEDGTPSEQFKAMKGARGDDDFRKLLQDWVKGIYADILTFADPSQDPYDRLVEAFRGYLPDGQRRAMAALLVGLWRFAGLPIADDLGRPTRSEPRQSRRKEPSSRRAVQVTLENRTTDPTVRSEPQTGARWNGSLPPALLGLLQQLPTESKSWTSEQKRAFLAAFEAVLDFTIIVREADAASGEHPNEGVSAGN